MILAVGEILFDHFPDYRRVGGAPLNFCWHLNKLGYPARLVSRVGDDPEGRELKELVAAGGMNAADLQVDPVRPTGAVKVALDEDGVPTFEILTFAAFDRIEMTRSLQSMLDRGPELIYYGTLVQRTGEGHRLMERVFSQAGEGTRFLCDVNLRPGCYSPGVVMASLARADVVKLNEEELDVISRFPSRTLSGVDPCRSLMERYDVSVVALTKGERGSELYSREGHHIIDPTGDLAVADTVGAGDAYASVLAIGCLEGWKPERILRTATDLASAVCTVEGALPQDDGFYDPFRGVGQG